MLLMNHLADCDDYAFSGAGFHPNCERICICRQVRRVEQQVLNAAREAVAGLRTYGDHGEVIPPDEEAAVIYVTDALAAIDALKEKP